MCVHQEKVPHVDMGFFQNAMLGKKSHVDTSILKNISFIHLTRVDATDSEI